MNTETEKLICSNGNVFFQHFNKIFDLKKIICDNILKNEYNKDSYNCISLDDLYLKIDDLDNDKKYRRRIHASSLISLAVVVFTIISSSSSIVFASNNIITTILLVLAIALLTYSFIANLHYKEEKEQRMEQLIKTLYERMNQEYCEKPLHQNKEGIFAQPLEKVE